LLKRDEGTEKVRCCLLWVDFRGATKAKRAERSGLP
jgi:hypothetical protein